MTLSLWAQNQQEANRLLAETGEAVRLFVTRADLTIGGARDIREPAARPSAKTRHAAFENGGPGLLVAFLRLGRWRRADEEPLPLDDVQAVA